MKKYLIFFILVTFLCSCKNDKDPIVAEAYNFKLYQSQVLENIPKGLSEQDSLAAFKKYVESWLTNKVILKKTEQSLNINEKNFDKKIQQFKEQLLVEAYYSKITSDTSQFLVSKAELKHFISEYKESESIKQDVVRVNYVKLSKKSTIGNQIKEILFNDEKRVNEKNKLIALCGDTLEYFINDDQWLLLDYLKQDFPFQINDVSQILNSQKKIDVSDNQYRYIVVFLDGKTQIAPSETDEETQNMKIMLMQHKKTRFINLLKDSLYNEAIKEGYIIK